MRRGNRAKKPRAAKEVARTTASNGSRAIGRVLAVVWNKHHSRDGFYPELPYAHRAGRVGTKIYRPTPFDLDRLAGQLLSFASNVL